MMIPVHVTGILYTIIFLKEVKPKAGQLTMESELQNSNNNVTLQISDVTIEKPKNACLEFFDPRLANQCIKSFVKKRDYGVRSILILLMVIHFITYGALQGEASNIILYQRVKFGWDITTSTYNNVFTIVISSFGMILMIGVLGKYLKVPDIVLCLISTAMTFTSKVIYSFVTTTVGYFIGTAVDFCSNVKILGTRAIVSKLVPART